jgi:hypothetical protein
MVVGPRLASTRRSLVSSHGANNSGSGDVDTVSIRRSRESETAVSIEGVLPEHSFASLPSPGPSFGAANKSRASADVVRPVRPLSSGCFCSRRTPICDAAATLPRRAAPVMPPGVEQAGSEGACSRVHAPPRWLHWRLLSFPPPGSRRRRSCRRAVIPCTCATVRAAAVRAGPAGRLCCSCSRLSRLAPPRACCHSPARAPGRPSHRRAVWAPHRPPGSPLPTKSARPAPRPAVPPPPSGRHPSRVTLGSLPRRDRSGLLSACSHVPCSASHGITERSYQRPQT